MMDWSYDPGTDSDLTWVREAIGDTDQNEPFLADATLTRVITAYGRDRGAIVAARRILAMFARNMSKSSGRGMTMQWKDRFDNYKVLVEQLEAEVGGLTGDAIPQLLTTVDEATPLPIFTRHMGEFHHDGMETVFVPELNR
jgi:hypothetical protein